MNAFLSYCINTSLGNVHFQVVVVQHPKADGLVQGHHMLYATVCYITSTHCVPQFASQFNIAA